VGSNPTGHGYLFFVSAVCFYLEVSEKNVLLLQRSPTNVVRSCMLSRNRHEGGDPEPSEGIAPKTTKYFTSFLN